MPEPVTLTLDAGLLTARLSRPHGNAINAEVVEGLIAACRTAEADPAVRGVLLAASGKLFCPGLDLQELYDLDRPAMRRFLDRFNACVLALYSLAKPMVAAVSGHAVAGGCVLALTADWRVLRYGAMIGLNEVRVGVPLPFGVVQILRDCVAGSRRADVALFGRNFSDDEALAAGLAHEVRDATGLEDHCRTRLLDLADRDGRAVALTKRHLRAATLDRIASSDARHADDWLDCWFAAPTRDRIAAIVRDLAARGG